MSLVAWILAGLCAVAFLVSYLREPRQLRNGVLFVATLLFILIAVTSGGPVAQAVSAVLLTPMLVLGAAGYLALVIFLLVNGVTVIRREGRSIALLLPLVAAVALIIAPIAIVIPLSLSGTRPGILLPALGVVVAGVFGYAGFVFLSFLTYGLLLRLRSANASSGAVLILGSRIFDGRVPPLLARRIDRAIEVYRVRERAGLELPVLIPSGGQGADESRREGVAMAEYLREQGIPESHILVEDKATTTEENLKLGAALAASARPGERLLIATNDYHTFRTALISRRLGIRAQVIAAPTARYYVPAAFLREFIAILRDYVWLHVTMLLIFAGIVGLSIWESFQLR